MGGGIFWWEGPPPSFPAAVRVDLTREPVLAPEGCLGGLGAGGRPTDSMQRQSRHEPASHPFLGASRSAQENEVLTGQQPRMNTDREMIRAAGQGPPPIPRAGMGGCGLPAQAAASLPREGRPRTRRAPLEGKHTVLGRLGTVQGTSEATVHLQGCARCPHGGRARRGRTQSPGLQGPGGVAGFLPETGSREELKPPGREGGA